MNFIDFFIILFLIFGIILGFKRGFIKSTIMLVGMIVIVVLAYYLKNPLVLYMYEKLPFFSLKGIFEGVTVINILLYEVIAFLTVLGLLGILFKLLLFFTKIIDKLLNLLIVLTIPSKILGMVVGLIESLIIVFIILFVSTQVNFFTKDIYESKFGSQILEKTPLLSGYTSKIYNAVNEIYELKDEYHNQTDKSEFNKKSFDTLLKHEVISTESAYKLVDSGKLKMDDAKEIIQKYEKEWNYGNY